MTQIEQLANLINQSRAIVFFGGAGVSTESGIPDFRSAEGLYQKGQKINPETILSRTFFDRQPVAFYAFYREKMVYPHAQPNDAHKGIAQLEQLGRLKAVVTQNIDGLHQAAGSKTVLELHGTISSNHCLSCHKQHTLSDVMQQENEARCACGGLIKPDVVLYEESLDSLVIEKAVQAIQSADMLIVGGTSLMVQPAASFARLCPGKLVIINRDRTAYDQHADLVLREPIGQVFKELMPLIKPL